MSAIVAKEHLFYPCMRAVDLDRLVAERPSARRRRFTRDGHIVLGTLSHFDCDLGHGLAVDFRFHCIMSMREVSLFFKRTEARFADDFASGITRFAGARLVNGAYAKLVLFAFF